MQLNLVLQQYVTLYDLWSLCCKMSFTFKLMFFFKYSLAKNIKAFYSDKYFLS